MTQLQTRQTTPKIASGRPAPRGTPAQQASTGLTPKDLFRVLLKRKWLILIGTFLIIGLSIVATVVWRSNWPIYTCRAFVEVQLPATTMLAMNQYANPAALDRERRNAAALIKSPVVLMSALESSEVASTGWYRYWQQKDTSLNRARQELDKEVNVSLVPETNFISISMSQVSGTRSQIQELPTIVNAVAEAFVNEANRMTTTQRDQEINTLEDRRRTLAREIIDITREIEEKMRVANIPATRQQVDTLTMELSYLTQRVTDIDLDRGRIESALISVREQSAQGLLESDPMVLQMLETDPILRGLEADLKSRKTQLQMVKSKYGPRNPNRQRLETFILSIEDEIASRRAELMQEQVKARVVDLQRQLATIQSELQQIQDKRTKALNQRRDLNQSLAVIENLDAEKAEREDRRRRIESRLEDMRLTRQDRPIGIRQPAEVPLEPSQPKPVPMILLGVVLGLFLSVGLAFLLELSDTSIKTPTDIARRVDIPLLAMVPSEEDLEEEYDDFRLAGLKEEHSPVSEAFRELRTNLLFSGPETHRRTLLVTSPSPDDGRTTVATNLAIALAHAGRKVLLIDANFRRPTLKQLFKIENEGGLSDVLSTQRPWREVVAETFVPNLSVLPSGLLPPNPNELLDSEVSERVLAELSESFDQVILDGPPFLLVSDAGVMATKVNGVILVVRAGVNTHGIVQRCRANLTRVGAHVIGGVLNGVRPTAGGYLRKHYDAFYDYHEIPEEKA